MDILLNNFQVILGWSLGLMSALIIEVYKRYISIKSIKKGIKSEVKELKLRLVAINIHTIMNYGTITKKWAKWIKPHYEELIKSDEFDYLKEKVINKSKINTLSVDKFYTLLKESQINRPTLSTPIYPKITLPYLDNNYNTVSMLKEQIIIDIAKLKREITGINSYIDQLWFYFKKTYENIEGNRKNIDRNIENITLQIAQRTRFVIKLIEGSINI